MDQDGRGFGDCLTYLGGGKVLARTGDEIKQSDDYGETWKTIAPVPRMEPHGRHLFVLGPLLVDKDPETGHVTRLTESGYDYGPDHGLGFKGFIRSSTDGGLTWPETVPAPWYSEVTLARAGNGDIVAAARTDGTDRIPDPDAPFDWRRVGGERDFYMGLGVHISKDNGRTWSPVNILFDYGRHHPSLALMPNNDLVMSYVVRLGYDDDPEGMLGRLPLYGIEAVVSRDHGQTWEMDRRYLLDQWDGAWLERPKTVDLLSAATTSTVVLPDGSLMTSYNIGIQGGKHLRHLKLVRWRLVE